VLLLSCACRVFQEAGYDLGDAAASLATDAALQLDGEALVAALKAMEDQRLVSGGASALMKAGAGPAEQFGVKPAAAEVSAARLKELLSFPPEWGPTEWGPIP
jgi:magnesium chelatase subunit H